MNRSWKWDDEKQPMEEKEYTLALEVFVNLDQRFTLLEIFNTVTGMNELLAIIVTESNQYATIKKL